MRNVSGYLTDDNRFFQDKKEAEAHEKFLSVGKLIEEFVREQYDKREIIEKTIQMWEIYKIEKTK